MIELLQNRCATRLVSLAGLLLFLAGTACASPDPTPAACPGESYPAVELEVMDDAGESLIGAGMRYRVDQGQWQEWPENLGRKTVIRGGPGLYQFEIGKQGYESAATTLQVPAVAEDICRPVSQEARLELARTPCPNPPAALSITVDPPVDELQASLNRPASGRERLECQEAAGDFCQRLSFPVAEIGAYELTLKELPGLGPMQVVSNVVAYQAQVVTFGLEHRGLAGTVTVSGTESVELSFPVRRDEVNCPLADFQALETTYPPDELAGDAGRRPPLRLVYQGSLLMTDLGAEACQTEPVLTALPFRAELPAGTDLAGVQVLVDYGEGWQAAECDFGDGRYLCQALVPNPLLSRPFAARILANGEATLGLSLPFSSMCLVFQ